jgi:hypothetical protein
MLFVIHFVFLGIVMRVIRKDGQVDRISPLMLLLETIKHRQNLFGRNRRRRRLEREQPISNFDRRLVSRKTTSG